MIVDITIKINPIKNNKKLNDFLISISSNDLDNVNNLIDDYIKVIRESDFIAKDVNDIYEHFKKSLITSQVDIA